MGLIAGIKLVETTDELRDVRVNLEGFENDGVERVKERNWIVLGDVDHIEGHSADIKIVSGH